MDVSLDVISVWSILGVNILLVILGLLILWVIGLVPSGGKEFTLAKVVACLAIVNIVAEMTSRVNFGAPVSY